MCKLLSETGHTPVTLDDLSTGHRSAVRWGPLVEGSVCDPELLRATRRAYSPEAVIHLAALSDVAQSAREPERYAEVNANGSRLIDEVFWDLPVVFSSSAAVYGASDQPLAEDAETGPISPYGQSKLDAEVWLTNAMCLRYFNVSGCDRNIGPGHKPQTHLIPRVLQAAMDGSVFTMQGGGAAVRDFVDVRDVALANVLALKTFALGPVNVSTGSGHSVTDVLRMAAKVTGRKIKTTIGPKRKGDPDKVVGRNGLARDLMGWEPKYPLQDQIAACWDWMSRERVAA